MNWKVEYYLSDSDRINGIKSFKEFDNFDSAMTFTITAIGNHMGEVRLIHPENN